MLNLSGQSPGGVQTANYLSTTTTTGSASAGYFCLVASRCCHLIAKKPAASVCVFFQFVGRSSFACRTDGHDQSGTIQRTCRSPRSQVAFFHLPSRQVFLSAFHFYFLRAAIATLFSSIFTCTYLSPARGCALQRIMTVSPAGRIGIFISCRNGRR